jgi:hypothetical protein
MAGTSRKRTTRSAAGALWNFLTLLLLVGAVCLISYFVLVFVNPQTPLNLFPPPTLPAVLVLPTESPTALNALPATWTPTVTGEPTSTVTPRPSNTPTTTPTFFVIPTATMTFTPTATKVPEFVLVGGVDHDRAGPTNGRGCDWMGVGGNVVDLDGNPVQGLTVVLGGEYENKAINKTTITGTATAYGGGGYEFTIADEPNSSRESMYIQLFSPNGKAISAQYLFRTYDDCAMNLVRMDFQQKQ